jgi:uncharacterized sulfatase
MLFQTFFKIQVSFLLSVTLVRVYEYFTIASKLFLSHSFLYELSGIVYDVWAWFIYSFVVFFLFALIYKLSSKPATIVLHAVNVILIMMYLALIIVFTERNTPFDHEFFTRSFKESWLTSKQMMTSGIKLYLPFVFYVSIYFIFYHLWIKNKNVENIVINVFAGVSFICVVLIKFANPAENRFQSNAAYNLTCNKFSFWMTDSYNYLKEKNKANKILTPEELATEVEFYQKNQPFDFTSKEYPLLHKNDEADVLGGFFNLNTTPPNIVIMVVEGLSRDFSGDNAYAGSFTPFLDSLSKHSLVWNNFLSTAPGTFAAQPAITGSVPYASRGFSLMNVMPDHLSLIKIFRKNGYWANFMIGFNPDFDNMGGYIRLQGTDFILNKYPSKYKEMGVGSEGWSMGYPDDALFNRSFEVMDSLKKYPYLNIYHTATTHMPYLFAQKPLYDKLFDKKLQTLKVSNNIKRTLRETKEVMVTYMFSDDCLRKFFSDYAKRSEYKNTIFFITGDHHIGSFPSTCGIDDYHVPLIIYSSMLKAPKKFLSVNSHNNLAPTITNLILQNYQMKYHPKEVHWLGSVMDTAIQFRNIHAMPFMEWSREITDYIYKGYYLSGDNLYKLTPDLLEEPGNNDSVKNYMIKLRENFKIINNYVTEKNKLFPVKENLLPGKPILLQEFTDTAEKNIYAKNSDTGLMADFKIPAGYKYLYVEASGHVNSPATYIDNHPSIRLALIDTKNNGRKYLYWSMRDLPSISTKEFIPQQWNAVSTKDMFTLDDYKKYHNLVFDLGIWTDSIPINFKLKGLTVKIYGIK